MKNRYLLAIKTMRLFYCLMAACGGVALGLREWRLAIAANVVAILFGVLWRVSTA